MEATAAPFSSIVSSRQNFSSSSSIRASSPASLFLSQKSIGNVNRKFKSPRSLSVRASSTSDSVVTLLDYGAGNVRSIRNALRHLGFSIKDVQTPGDILNADRLIFPGVGAFAPAMDVLNRTGYLLITSADFLI
jgi:glutamine amidotransferase/cyclase